MCPCVSRPGEIGQISSMESVEFRSWRARNDPKVASGTRLRVYKAHPASGRRPGGIARNGRPVFGAGAWRLSVRAARLARLAGSPRPVAQRLRPVVQAQPWHHHRWDYCRRTSRNTAANARRNGRNPGRKPARDFESRSGRGHRGFLHEKRGGGFVRQTAITLNRPNGQEERLRHVR